MVFYSGYKNDTPDWLFPWKLAGTSCWLPARLADLLEFCRLRRSLRYLDGEGKTFEKHVHSLSSARLLQIANCVEITCCRSEAENV